MKINYFTLFFLVYVLHSQSLMSQNHPNLVLTKSGVETIKSSGKAPLFDKALLSAKLVVESEILLGIDVPMPEGMAGGYSHTRHKKNYSAMHRSGILYQIYGEEKYALYVKSMLLKYAEMYSTYEKHPERRSYAPGKFFWQSLNDANWLVYSSQAYDCIYDYCSEEERNIIENELLRPHADFLSIGNPKFFNRIHNHSTWGNVAVGMAGLVLNDDELVNRALYGLDTDNISATERDNDGGLIKNKDGKAGFIANLDEPFSPDGYYTEGPYYQRYAMYPFLVFAQALENSKPELEIFEYKDSVLIKAVSALINLSDYNGDFFALNDGQKGMSIKNGSVVSAVGIAYYYGGKNPELLSIAKEQGKVDLDLGGLEIAKAINEGKGKTFQKNSIELRDGKDGSEGAIGILRSHGDKEIEMVFKYSGHGLSHGHFDKLSYSLYENGKELFQDYGLARFVNIKQKKGGGYLKENKTWAKQTIAHNTVVQNSKSQYNAKFDASQANHSNSEVFSTENKDVQVVSATENNAYENSKMRRTLALIDDEELKIQYVIDLFEVESEEETILELPFYYKGQIIENLNSKTVTDVYKVMGKEYGYQHLLLEKQSKAIFSSRITWKNDDSFYTLKTETSSDDELLFARIGVNDPEFNLRNDPVLIIKKKGVKGFNNFNSTIEVHGKYSPVIEYGEGVFPKIKSIETIFQDKEYTAVKIIIGDVEKIFIFSKDSKKNKHKLKINGNKYKWSGPFYYN